MISFQGQPIVDDLDKLYVEAIGAAGENPNALGFLRRHPPSHFYRPPPAGMPPDRPSHVQYEEAIAAMRLAVATGRW